MKFTAKELSSAIQFLGREISSADNYHTYSKSSIHRIVYSELEKLSKEEIESHVSDRWNESIKDSILDIRNSYLFSILINREAFYDSFSPETKWILKHTQNKDAFIYEMAYSFEYDARQEPKNKKMDVDFLFDIITRNGHEQFQSSNQIVLLEAFCNEFFDNKKQLIINYLFNNAHLKEDVCFDFLVTKLHDKNINLKNNTSFNKKFLPASTGNINQNLFISSMATPSIEKLFKAGFTFNEKEYEYNGKNLFLAVITSERKDIIDLILPTITDVTPKTGTFDEQTNFINDFCSVPAPSKVPQSLLKLIHKQYMKLSLNHSLENSNQTKKSKIKI